MAELMCNGCHQTLPEGTPYCPTCFSIPVAKPIEPAPDPVPAAVPGSATAVCRDPDCGTGGVPADEGCRACGLKGKPAAALRFAWGPVAVEAGQPLVIGRENSPIADRLGDYSNISRKHAEVRSDGTSLTVVDLDSMNGTFLNEERLAPNRPTPVRPGDRLRFAARLEATVDGGPA